jgi:glycosyltransferase involved in cell wall biosynthesis
MYLDELRKEMETRGVRVDLLPIMAKAWSTIEGKIPVHRLLRTSQAVATIGNYDLVHTQFTFPIGSILSLLKPFHRRPVIIHTHGDDVFVVPSVGLGFRRSAFGELATRIAWQTTTHIIAVCRRAKAEIRKAGVKEAKISVLHNGVNEAFFSRDENLEDNPYSTIREDSDFTFLNVGALKEIKNHAGLIEAFSLYLKNSGSNSKLIICGTGHLKEMLRALVHRLSISDNVVFLGKVPHNKMPLLYSVVDGYVMPSLHEAHPWSILEAMSCELPVVASNVGGIPETISNQELLINPWETNSICQAMQYLAENPTRSRTIGAQNRKTVQTRFTLRQHASRLESIYSQVFKKDERESKPSDDST